MKVVQYQDEMIECYGDLEENSNFHVVCHDEEQDDVWVDGNPNSEDYTFESWEQVVQVLSEQDCFDSGIIEISAV
jgi:hypothetical protein